MTIRIIITISNRENQNLRFCTSIFLHALLPDCPLLFKTGEFENGVDYKESIGGSSEQRDRQVSNCETYMFATCAGRLNRVLLCARVSKLYTTQYSPAYLHTSSIIIT